MKPNAKKNVSHEEDSKQAMPLDQPMKVGSLEPMKINLDDAVHSFARQTTRSPYYLDVPAAKSLQPDQQAMIPGTQGFKKPYYAQGDLKEQRQFQAMRAPPGLGGDTCQQDLPECQRFRQDLNLGDRPPVPQDSNLHYELGALCMALVKDLQGNVWDSPSVSGYSPSQCEKPAMRGNHRNSMEGIDHTSGDFGMTSFNCQVSADNMKMPKRNRGGALAGAQRPVTTFSEAASLITLAMRAKSQCWNLA